MQALLLVAIFASAADAANVFFAGGVNDTVSISAPYLAGVQSITIAGQSCALVSNVSIPPCIPALTRAQLCGVQATLTPVFSGTPCTTSMNPCYNYSSVGDISACAPSVTPDGWCRVSACVASGNICVVIGGNNTFFNWQYTNTNFVGVACAPGMVCDATLKCVTTTPPQCPGTVRCTVSGVPAGVHGAVLVFSNGSSTVLPGVVTALEVPVIEAVVVGGVAAQSPDAVSISASTPFEVVWSNASAIGNYTLHCDSPTQIIQTIATTAFDIQTDLVHEDLVYVVLYCAVIAVYPALNFTAAVPGAEISAIVTAIPSVYTTCPAGIYAGLRTTVAVDGDYFAPSENLTCIVDGVPQPGLYISRGAVQCELFWPNETLASQAVISVSISNDGVTAAAAPALVHIVGACGNIKPNSVPGGGGCECPPGYFDAGTYCQPCAVGTYQPDYNQRSCLACGADQTTAPSDMGLASAALCICKPGFYASDNASLVCSACPPGFTCNGTAVTVNAGFWRASTAQMATTPCGSPKQCPGGEGAGPALCGPAYKGPLCQVCRKGYGALGGECVKCPPDGLSGFMLFVVVGAVAAVVVLLVRATATFEFDEGTMGVTFKVAFAYFQILFYVGKLAARWSSQSAIFFSALVPVTLTPSFVAVQCASRTSFYTGIAVVMAFPAIAWVCIAAFYLARGVWIRRDALGRSTYPWADIHDDRIKSTYVVWYLMHPVIAEAVIRSLRCTPVPGTGTTFLVDNPEVDCSSASYRRYYGVAWAYTIIYILGFIVYLLVHIYMCAPEVLGTRKAYDVGVGKWFVFFVRGYTDNHYLWEFMIVMRKLGVVIADSLLPPEVQLVWAGIAIGASLAATVQTFPYARLMINYLDIMALSALFFTVVLGLHQRLLAGPDEQAVFVLLVFVNTIVGFVIVVAMFASSEHIWQRPFNFLRRKWSQHRAGDAPVEMYSRQGKVN
jgi:hypothetical protein